jgi:hypothetical protein
MSLDIGYIVPEKRPVSLTVEVSNDIKIMLDDIAEENGTTLSDVMRNASRCSKCPIRPRKMDISSAWPEMPVNSTEF